MSLIPIDCLAVMRNSPRLPVSLLLRACALIGLIIAGGGILSAQDIALNRFASQSSTLASSPSAGVAVDGNTDGNYYDGSVTATNADSNAWWQVDLGSGAVVNSIVIWNRTDCCGSRLNDYWVFVSNTPFLASDTPATLQNRPGTWSSHQTIQPNPSTTISVGGYSGEFVRVQLSGTNI